MDASLEAKLMAQRHADRIRTEEASDDVKPYTLEELDALEAAMTPNSPWRRLLATAKQGVEAMATLGRIPIRTVERAQREVAAAVERGARETTDGKCPTCNGSGVQPEYHGQGLTEYLGCIDCSGTGRVSQATLDTERLDWLMGNGFAGLTARCDSAISAFDSAYPNGGLVTPQAVRAAIDAARESDTTRSGQRLHSNSQAEKE